MSKQMKLKRCLFSIDLKQSITTAMFFHCCKLCFFFAIVLLMRSRIFLLSFPISEFLGLMSLQVGLFAKFSFWSFSVINPSLLAVVSSFVAMSLVSLWMLASSLVALSYRIL